LKTALIHILIILFSFSLYSQEGIVFEEGEKSPNKNMPGKNARKITILGGVAFNKINFEDKYHPIAASEIQFRSPFWYNQDNFSSKRIGAGINFDYLFRENGQYLVTVPVNYSYGKGFSVFIGAGFLNKETTESNGNETFEKRISILAIRFGLAYELVWKSFVLKARFNEDFLGDDSSYQLSLLLGYTF
jgi:hypothetical protein